ncbi:PepSY-associated TM helix domain-containing protein [Methylotenera sp. N17]|uniref:PepSY-associated TM helix domain-containing protein n=1 Tax=Methylotenera sp. N17 TaxID=1502761 RepID=UPI000648BB19|nr:PepSY-associated TM helix domain-containing protein [Methylotenera sp. N17]
MNRKLWVVIHRWLGLIMAGFLLIIGLTGSLLAFYPELEGWINPELYPTEQQGKPMMSLAQLALRAEQLQPQAMATRVQWGAIGSRAVYVAPKINPETNQLYSLPFNQIFINPYTGEQLGLRQFGAISQGMINFMPFIYRLHYELALSDFGMWALGIIALIWTLDCFIGLYLTFPAKSLSIKRQRIHTKKSWLARWKPAWLIRWHANAYKLNFDLHRSGGLWLWLILLTFAWSSVYMNLWDTVYTKATQSVMEYKAYWTEFKPVDDTTNSPHIGWLLAEQIAQNLMAEKATTQGFKVIRAVSLYYNKSLGVYDYRVRSSRDIQDHGGQTQLFIDANTGAFKLLLLPTGQYEGNTVTTWLFTLHMANILGLPYKVFVSVLGVAIVMLSITGVYIWLRKRISRSAVN